MFRRDQFTPGGNLTASPIFQTGYNSNVQASTITLWNFGGLYPWQTGNNALSVASTDNGDTNDVRVMLLEENTFAQSIIDVTLTGQTPVSLGDFQYVNRTVVLTEPDPGGDIHVGFGTFTAGVPATTLGYISAGENTSQSCTFTVPQGFSILFSQLVVNAEKNAFFVSCISVPGLPFWELGRSFTTGSAVIVKPTILLDALGASNPFGIPTLNSLPAGTRVEVRTASLSGQPDNVGGFFELYMVEDI